MNTERIRVRMTFIDSILGSEPSNPELHEDYIQTKIPEDMYSQEELEKIKAEEIQALMDGEVKGRTVFYRNEDGEPCLKNNHIKGFFKSACAALRTDKTNLSSKITSYKKEIDLHVFVYADADDPASRFIPIQKASVLRWRTAKRFRQVRSSSSMWSSLSMTRSRSGQTL